MRFTSIPVVLSLSFLAGLTPQLVSGHSGHKVLRPRRTSSMLINPDAFPDLPTAAQAKTVSAAANLNLDDIQGDILVGMKKKKELFFFFSIEDVAAFKSKLESDIASLVTSTTQLLSISTQPTTALNIAFSQSGLVKLGIDDFDGKSTFGQGQAADSNALGDPGVDKWADAFVGTSIHGVFLIASDTMDNINVELANIQTILGTSILEKHSVQGEARPGSEEGHEHFGFMDGISQPAVRGFTATPMPGQTVIEPGIILVNEPGDDVGGPVWATGGSYLAFRQLKQLVPEFDKFLTDNPLLDGGLTPEQGSALLGARMMGRWKSGAPIVQAVRSDDPELAADPQRNNNFTFVVGGESFNQIRCPWSAHIRKTNPRADIPPTNHHVMRAGIPYGPEVTKEEAASNTTSTERGLAFVSYQSDLGQGFRFLQIAWANSENFVRPGTGFDPIIGANQGRARNVSGLYMEDVNRKTTLVTDFVESRGGEYFFSPPISAIKGTLAV